MTDLRRGVRQTVADRRHGRAFRGCPASRAYIDVILLFAVGYRVGYGVSAPLSCSHASVVRN